MAGEDKSWLPIESNPGVMTRYAKKLGCGSALKFYDLLSTEEWALEMIPKPVYAVLMLFPIKPATEVHREEEEARIAAGGQHIDPRLYYTKQTIRALRWQGVFAHPQAQVQLQPSPQPTLVVRLEFSTRSRL